MTEEYIISIVEKLKNCEIEFAVTGGCARFLRNEIVYTNDLDILVRNNENNCIKINTFIDKYVKSDIDVSTTLKNKSIIRLKIFPYLVDILPYLDGLDTDDVFSKTEIIYKMDIEIPIISKEHLIQNYKSIENGIISGSTK
jgi:predicted nucleotidyltransferase